MNTEPETNPQQRYVAEKSRTFTVGDPAAVIADETWAVCDTKWSDRRVVWFAPNKATAQEVADALSNEVACAVEDVTQNRDDLVDHLADFYLTDLPFLRDDYRPPLDRVPYYSVFSSLLNIVSSRVYGAYLFMLTSAAAEAAKATPDEIAPFDRLIRVVEEYDGERFAPRHSPDVWDACLAVSEAYAQYARKAVVASSFHRGGEKTDAEVAAKKDIAERPMLADFYTKLNLLCLWLDDSPQRWVTSQGTPGPPAPSPDYGQRRLILPSAEDDATAYIAGFRYLKEAIRRVRVGDRNLRHTSEAKIL